MMVAEHTVLVVVIVDGAVVIVVVGLLWMSFCVVDKVPTKDGSELLMEYVRL
jgi:hypothetical protein